MKRCRTRLRKRVTTARAGASQFLAPTSVLFDHRLAYHLRLKASATFSAIDGRVVVVQLVRLGHISWFFCVPICGTYKFI